MSTSPSPRQSTEALSVPEEVIAAIHQMRSPVVVTHVVPDADALGSTLALVRALTSDNRRPKASLPDGSLSQRLEFMVRWADMPIAKPESFAAADGFIVLDTAKKSRCNVGTELKKTDWSSGRPIVNVDHHRTNTRFGEVNWVVDGAGSTAELVYCLLRAADRPISPLVASLLYAGILTDTLGFSLPTTSAPTLSAAAQLVALGADVAQLGERLCRSQHKSEFDLLRIVYDNTRLAADGRLAYSFATYEEIHGAGCTAADIDDQITVPRSLSGVELAILFTEGNRGKTRMNFRGSGDVTVIDLAAEFNGGGHSQAAGAILDCGVHETIEKVLPRALEHLKKFRR